MGFLVVANLYMELFDELALESASSRPRFCNWYVDDTCLGKVTWMGSYMT